MQTDLRQEHWRRTATGSFELNPIAQCTGLAVHMEERDPDHNDHSLHFNLPSFLQIYLSFGSTLFYL